MTTLILFLIDRPLVCHTGMYMFDLQLAVQLAYCIADCTADSNQTCTFQCLIPMGDLLKIGSAWL